MAYNLHITFGAEMETQNAVEYYFKISDLLVDRFLSELNIVYTKVAANPQFYKYIPKRQHRRFRYTRLKSFPFIVVFRVQEQSVVIYRVFNTHRKPWYK